MPRRVRQAILIAFVLQGVLVLTARYRLSYDAYTHMFFADHYRLNWWSLWDPRWYTGFYVDSYPPLVHQIIGLLGRLIGVEAGFAIVLWLTLSTFPLAVYVFSRIFIGPSSAGYAALGAAVLPSIYLSAHTFGQLPFLVGTLFSLLAAACLANFLRSGRRLDGALAVGLVAVIIGAHHATLLFLPWIFGAVIIYILLNRQVSLQKLLIRSATFGIFAIGATAIVIWPFWVWGAGQVMQTPIDHASRHNYFQDFRASLDYFWPAYGPLLALIPMVIWNGFTRRYFGLSLSFLLLFILGLGGTTPLPRWLFGSGWAWLTYDRFALWATLLLLPFFGIAVILFKKKLRLRHKVRERPRNWPERWGLIAIFSSMALVALGAALFPTISPTQPRPVDMKPIVTFLNNDGRSQWRYVTFGFGDQFAYLSRLTTATTIDGSYHTARTLPELRQSGIGQIDTAYWSDKGLSALDPILQAAGQHGLRWGFVDLAAYIPILLHNGWQYLQTLSNGIQVWENPRAILPGVSQPPADNPLAEFSWGVLPLLALTTTAGLGALRLWPVGAQKVLYKIHAVLIGLLPISLNFWYFHTIVALDHPRVYFTYDNALIYISDAIGLAAVLVWGIARIFGPLQSDQAAPVEKLIGKRVRQFLKSPEAWLFALCLMVSISIAWSRDWRVSLYISLQIWLIFGLVLSLRDRPSIWRVAAIGSCIALALQVIIGIWQFAAQSTSILTPLGIQWPGAIVPSIRGASVVQLLDGERWLRVYGTVPHPNILGGFVVAWLIGPVLLFLTAKRGYYWILILFGSGIVLLVLTFSRGAWIGMIATGLFLVLHSRSLNRRRLTILGGVSLASLLLITIPLHELVYTRVSDSPVFTEQLSIETRAWLIRRSIEMIRQYPILGVGVGSFLIEFAQHVPRNFTVEPVHSLPLLVISELGIGGLIILIGLGITLLLGFIRAQQPTSIILGAALAGLCVTSLFDHYLWSLAPGRMLIGFMFGLWLGQMHGLES